MEVTDMLDEFSAQVDFDQFDSPGDVYDVVTRSQYHSLSTDVSPKQGSTTYRFHIPSGGVHVGNAWADVANSRYGFETNDHGRVSELWNSFWLYIPDHFVLSGTDHRFYTPAISYSSGNGHSGGGNPDGTNGWSVRLQLSDRGGPGWDLVEYTYNMDTGNDYSVYSAPIDHGWNHFVTHVKCNTYSNGSANADGVSECWVNGELAYSNDDWRFTTTASNEIEYAGPGGFYGGGGAPTAVDLYYDAHELCTNADDKSGTAPKTPSSPFDSALTPSSGSNGDSAIVHDSHEMAAGNRYEARLQFESTDGGDMGLLFGAQTAESFDSYTGYLAFLDTGEDEIRLDRWNDGSLAVANSSSASFPVGEPLTLSIDWRFDDEAETYFVVTDEGGEELASVSMSDTTFDRGGMGIYRFHGGGEWFLESFGHADGASVEPVPDDYHTLEVAGQFEYRVEVDGEIRPSEDHARWLSEGDAYGDDWAEWWLSGGENARTVWEFTGEITDLQIDDYDGETDIRTLAVDGEEIDHEKFVDGDRPSTLEVAGQFEYRVEVDGEIQPSQAHAQWLESGEAYGDDWAEWWLSGGENARTVWEFTGEITDLQIDDYDGDTDIRTLAVDGEELDHDEFVDPGPSELEVAGQFEYRVEVDGEIWPSDDHARWLSEGDAYGDDWAEWWLSGGENARTVWEFTGEITDLQIDDYDGETDIRTLAVDGEELDHS